MTYGTRKFNTVFNDAMIPILTRINQFLIISPIILGSNLGLDLPRGQFPVDLPVTIFKAPLPSSILDKYSAHFNLLDLITLTTIGKCYNL